MITVLYIYVCRYIYIYVYSYIYYIHLTISTGVTGFVGVEIPEVFASVTFCQSTQNQQIT